MKDLTKALVGTVAAGAMAVSSAIPAFAQDHRRHDRDGIGAGEVIAGALIIGGIAALASSSNDRYRNRWGSPRQAIEQCVRAAERTASRRSWRGGADVTDIRRVKETRRGYEVRGRIAVNAMGRGWRRGDSTYGRGWNGDYRGWNHNLRGYDSGSFTCRTERGRIAMLDFNGIRGL